MEIEINNIALYSIVDVETTGGKFNEEGITEIAIYKFDGNIGNEIKKIEEQRAKGELTAKETVEAVDKIKNNPNNNKNKRRKND